MFTARSALTLLADGPSGCTEQVMRAFGFPSELITKVVDEREFFELSRPGVGFGLRVAQGHHQRWQDQ